MPQPDVPTFYDIDPRGPLARLYVHPDLPCRDRVGDFDVDVDGDETPEERASRLADAIRCCRTCPAISLCGDAFAELPSRFRRGVWAGQARGVGARTTRAIQRQVAAS